MEFPLLFARSCDGREKQWKIEVIDRGHCAVVRRTHGFVNMKQTVSEKTIDVGKNIGRANETSYLQQAISEATSIFKRQREKGYGETNAARAPLLPMLAHEYSKRKHNIRDKYALQPKIDGVRLVAAVDGNSVALYSRTGKPVDILDHMKADIAGIARDAGICCIDGEFFSTLFPFEVISGIFRKKKLTPTDVDMLKKIQFHVFDAFDPEAPDTPFSSRHDALRGAFGRYNGSYLTLVPTEFCCEASRERRDAIVRERHMGYVAQGYEGIVVRNSDGGYMVGYRSPDLQKHKEFCDAEYKITGGVEATGNDAGTVVFVCETSCGHTFNVRPRGSREVRRQWLLDIDSLIGKMLTVRFQELCENGVPRFGVGVQIRDYE